MHSAHFQNQAAHAEKAKGKCPDYRIMYQPEMYRPEKGLQSLLLILIFIYKFCISPDIGLQLV